MKYAIIGDLHLGLKSNSEIFYKISIDYVKWLKSILLNKQIYNIIFLGDIFHNREEISVQTIQVMTDFFNLLKEFNIKILVGNHDLFYKDRTDVSSISPLNEWNNIEVIKNVKLFEIENRKLLFIPWGFNINDLIKADVYFGHFELNYFYQTLQKICENGLDPEIFNSKTNLVFSGHFHIHQIRDIKNTKIIYVGSCFQNNWGEMGTEKGFYILNLNDLNYEFIKNTISPIHEKIILSKFLNDKKYFNEKIKLISNNFIKLIVDIDIDYDKIEKINNKLFLLNPLDLNIEFDIIKDEINIKNFKSEIYDIKDCFYEYINSIETSKDKKRLFDIIMKIYQKSI